MASRNELNVRARALGFDPSTIANDSKLEQKILYLEKNATAITGAAGAQTLTTTGTFSAGEIITIGSVTYTMRAALTGAKATQTLTGTDVFSNGELISVDGVTYVMRTALSSPAVVNEVLIGADLATSLDNLKLAINAGATAGTEYSLGTAVHPEVNATTNTDTTQVVEANDFNVTNASIATTKTAANASWGAGTLASGTAKIVAVAAAGTRDTNAGISGDKNVG